MEADDHDECAAELLSRAAEHARDLAAEDEPDQRHAGLEGPEDDADPQFGASVDAAEPDPDRGGAVRCTERDGGEQQPEHPRTLCAGRSERVPVTLRRTSCQVVSDVAVARAALVW